MNKDESLCIRILVTDGQDFRNRHHVLGAKGLCLFSLRTVGTLEDDVVSTSPLFS